MAERLPFPYQRDPSDTHPDPPEHARRITPDEQSPHVKHEDEPGPGGKVQPMLRQADVPEYGKSQYGLKPLGPGGWGALFSGQDSNEWTQLGEFQNLSQAFRWLHHRRREAGQPE